MATLPDPCGTAVAASVTLPAQRQARLPAHRQLGHVAGVDEQVRRRLVVGFAAGQELAVRQRDQVGQGAARSAALPAVGAERVGAAQAEPARQGPRSASASSSSSSWLPSSGTSLQCPASATTRSSMRAAVRPAIDVVAEHDERVRRAGRDGVEEGGERVRTRGRRRLRWFVPPCVPPSEVSDQ